MNAPIWLIQDKGGHVNGGVQLYHFLLDDLGEILLDSEGLETQSVKDDFASLDVLTLGVIISKLKCYKRMSFLNRGWTS